MRGPYELCLNFAAEERHVPAEGTRVVLATHPDATALEPGGVRLGPQAGVVITAG